MFSEPNVFLWFPGLRPPERESYIESGNRAAVESSRPKITLGFGNRRA